MGTAGKTDGPEKSPLNDRPGSASGLIARRHVVDACALPACQMLTHGQAGAFGVMPRNAVNQQNMLGVGALHPRRIAGGRRPEKNHGRLQRLERGQHIAVVCAAARVVGRAWELKAEGGRLKDETG